MRPFPIPFPVAAGAGGNGTAPGRRRHWPGPVTYRQDPQAVFAGESLSPGAAPARGLRPGGLPVLSGDGLQVQGWITGASVLQGRRRARSAPPGRRAPRPPAGHRAAPPGWPDGQAAAEPGPPTPLPGYQVLEVTLGPGSPAAGPTLGTIRWPAASFAVAVLRHRGLQDADPRLLAAGDRVACSPGHRGPQPHGHRRPAGMARLT